MNIKTHKLVYQRPLIMGHRGSGGKFPENTLQAFEYAVQSGADVLETDIQLTADRVPVVIHDESIDRTTNGSGMVKDFSLNQLKKFDAGYRFTPDNGKTYPFRHRGLHIPTLAEVFSAFPRIPMNIDIKTPEAVKPFIRVIEDYQQETFITAASFDLKTIYRFRRLCPQIKTSASQPETILFFLLQKLRLEILFRSPAMSLQIPEYENNIKVLTERFLAAAHRIKRELHVWTVNDEPSMLRLINMGVDGIITDYPDNLAQLYRKMEL